MLDRIREGLEQKFVSGPKDKQPLFEFVRRPDLAKNLIGRAQEASRNEDEAGRSRYGYLAWLVEKEGALHGAVSDISAMAVGSAPHNLAGAELNQAIKDLKEQGTQKLIEDYSQAGINFDEKRIKQLRRMVFGDR